VLATKFEYVLFNASFFFKLIKVNHVHNFFKKEFLSWNTELFKKKYSFQEFILQVLLNIWQRAIQGEHKRILHFKNDTENKCGVLTTSHLHQSIEKLSKFCTHLTETRYVCSASHTADVETIIQLAPSFVQSFRSDGSYGSCDSRKWILGWVVPCEIMCEMHVAHSFFANCRTHQLLCCRVAIFKTSGI
jgi:hypothetical protein